MDKQQKHITQVKVSRPYLCDDWKNYGIKKGRQAHTLFSPIVYCLRHTQTILMTWMADKSEEFIKEYLEKGYELGRRGHNYEKSNKIVTINNDIVGLAFSAPNNGTIVRIV